MSVTQNIAKAVIAAGFFAAPLPAVAQSAAAIQAVQIACAISAEACQQAVEAAIAELRAAGLADDAFNEQLGVIAGVALTAASSLPQSERTLLAGLVRELAADSTNTGQSDALNNLAILLEGGSDLDLQAFAQSLSAN